MNDTNEVIITVLILQIGKIDLDSSQQSYGAERSGNVVTPQKQTSSSRNREKHHRARDAELNSTRCTLPTTPHGKLLRTT